MCVAAALVVSVAPLALGEAVASGGLRKAPRTRLAKRKASLRRGNADARGDLGRTRSVTPLGADERELASHGPPGFAHRLATIRDTHPAVFAEYLRSAQALFGIPGSGKLTGIRMARVRLAGSVWDRAVDGVERAYVENRPPVELHPDERALVDRVGGSDEGFAQRLASIRATHPSLFAAFFRDAKVFVWAMYENGPEPHQPRLYTSSRDRTVAAVNEAYRASQRRRPARNRRER